MKYYITLSSLPHSHRGAEERKIQKQGVLRSLQSSVHLGDFSPFNLTWYFKHDLKNADELRTI